MEDDSLEKEHLATSKRLADLRKKGVVLRSRDLSGGLVFLAMIGALGFTASQIAVRIKENFIGAFTGIKQLTADPLFLLHFFRKIALDNFMLLLPLFFIVLMASVIAPFIFGGWNFSLTSIQFNFDKLNPINNIPKIFSPKKAAMEIVRSTCKGVLILGVLIYFVFVNKSEMVELMNFPVKMAISSSFFMIKQFVVLLSVALIVLVAFDIVYQFYQFQSTSKMSSQELKDEYKEAEGSVDVKRKIRSAQFAVFKQRLSSSVPKANVIVTNPSHYAVALKYDEKKDRSPKVIAKGKGQLAHQIRFLAIANAIPIYEAPPLARAIYHTTKLNAEIRPELYMAVAIVLSYVHQLKNYQLGMGAPPSIVRDLEIPKELTYDD